MMELFVRLDNKHGNVTPFDVIIKSMEAVQILTGDMISFGSISCSEILFGGFICWLHGPLIW